MDFFFYLAISLTVLLLPIFVSAEGAFDLDRRYLSVNLRLFGIKILSVKVYFSDDGAHLSINGGKGKPFAKKQKKSKIPIKVDPIRMIRIRTLSLTLSVGGHPTTVSYALGAALSSLSGAFAYLEEQGVLDKATIRVVPHFSGESAKVIFSTKIFTSIAMVLSGLSHTTRGEKDEKRSIGKYDGQDAFRPERRD